jgi:hypothetical protein
MKTRVIQEDRPKAIETRPPEASAEPTSPTPGRRGPTSSQRVAVLVLAGFLAIVGLLALLGGGALLWADTAKTDADGYYSSSPHRFSTTGRALVANGLEAGTGDLSFLLDSGRIAQIRLTSASNDPSAPLFVGIGSEQDVAAYLRDVETAEIGDLDFDPFHVSYSTRSGSAAPTPPGGLGIWAATSTGAGTETLWWPTEEGDWSVVVMNADGSPNVDADIAVAGKAPLIFRLGLGLAIGGFVLAFVAATILILTLRSRPRTPAVAASPFPPAV